MDPCSNMGCVLKVNASCEACRRKVLQVLSSLCDTCNVSIDAQIGLAYIRQRVDINLVLHTLAKSGQYAELVQIRVPSDPLPHRRHVAFANTPLPIRNELGHCHRDGRIGRALHHQRQGRHGFGHHPHVINRIVHHHHHHCC